MAAHRCVGRYPHDPKGSVFVWLWSITINKLREIHRRELGTEKRDARWLRHDERLTSEEAVQAR